MRRRRHLRLGRRGSYAPRTSWLRSTNAELLTKVTWHQSDEFSPRLVQLAQADSSDEVPGHGHLVDVPPGIEHPIVSPDRVRVLLFGANGALAPDGLPIGPRQAGFYQPMLLVAPRVAGYSLAIRLMNSEVEAKRRATSQTRPRA